MILIILWGCVNCVVPCNYCYHEIQEICLHCFKSVDFCVKPFVMLGTVMFQSFIDIAVSWNVKFLSLHVNLYMWVHVFLQFYALPLMLVFKIKCCFCFSTFHLLSRHAYRLLRRRVWTIRVCIECLATLVLSTSFRRNWTRSVNTLRKNMMMA